MFCVMKVLSDCVQYLMKAVSSCCRTLVNVQYDSKVSCGCSDNVRMNVFTLSFLKCIFSFMKNILLLCGCYVCFLA